MSCTSYKIQDRFKVHSVNSPTRTWYSSQTPSPVNVTQRIMCTQLSTPAMERIYTIQTNGYTVKSQTRVSRTNTHTCTCAYVCVHSAKQLGIKTNAEHCDCRMYGMFMSYTHGMHRYRTIYIMTGQPLSSTGGGSQKLAPIMCLSVSIITSHSAHLCVDWSLFSSSHITLLHMLFTCTDIHMVHVVLEHSLEFCMLYAKIR